MSVRFSQFTEEQVLRKLNIPDFRHLSKDKIMTFFFMLPNMDPEVAKKALEQFPSYAGAVKEIIAEYNDFLDKALADNAESVQSYYSICKEIIEALSKLIEQDSLSFDEKMQIAQMMLEVEARANKKDRENKKHIQTIVVCAAVVAIVTIGGLAAVLGANSGVSISDLKDDFD